ncbi:hypothetical protein BH20ACT15_BH20ACT15_14560 [soil metagenome]
MTAAELEERADALLAEVPEWIWDGESLPVPIEAIADTHVGLLIRDVDDMTAAPGCPELAPDQSLSGLLLAARGEIWVNATEAAKWPTRRRFTIGHELGHWQLHRKPGHQSLFCRKSAVIEENESEDTNPGLSIEDQANIFAAAVTMPGHLMRAHYEKLRREPDCHPRMCTLFGASGAAMGRRLHTAI